MKWRETNYTGLLAHSLRYGNGGHIQSVCAFFFSTIRDSRSRWARGVAFTRLPDSNWNGVLRFEFDFILDFVAVLFVCSVICEWRRRLLNAKLKFKTNMNRLSFCFHRNALENWIELSAPSTVRAERIESNIVLLKANDCNRFNESTDYSLQIARSFASIAKYKVRLIVWRRIELPIMRCHVILAWFPSIAKDTSHELYAPLRRIDFINFRSFVHAYATDAIHTARQWLNDKHRRSD